MIVGWALLGIMHNKWREAQHLLDLEKIRREGREGYWENELKHEREWTACWRARAIDLQRNQTKHMEQMIDIKTNPTTPECVFFEYGIDLQKEKR